MALLGLVSLAQIWFIPGYLLLYRTTTLTPIDKALLAVPLSATINFFLVYALVLAELYTQQAVIFIFAAEMIALLSLRWRKPTESNQLQTGPTIRIGFDLDLTNVAFALLVLICTGQVLNQFGTVFTQGDAVIGWNTLAIAWYNNIIPINISWYPQLLPTLYSLTYQFIADSRIELFAKIAISFYPLFTLAIFARMAWLLPTERKKILWSAIIFFLLIRRLWGTESTVNGYAELPLAFFSLSIVYIFALGASTRVSKDLHTLALVLIGITIGTGLMKHSGVFLGMLVPLFWLIYFRNGREWREHIQQSLLIGVAIALGYAPWYLYQYWRIQSGIDVSNLGVLSNIVPLPWYESIVFGFKGITYKLSWFWVILCAASLLRREIRYMALGVVLPFFLLWAAFVPYDYRNLAVVFPLLAMTLAYGWAELARLSKKIFSIRIFKVLPVRRILVLLTITAFAFMLSDSKYNDELLRLSNIAKNQIGDPEINSRLLAYFEFHPAKARIATPYQEISKIPDLAERYAPFSCGFDYGRQTMSMERILTEISELDIRHVLLFPRCDSRVLAYFGGQPEKFHAVFQVNGATFYELKDRLSLNMPQFTQKE